MHGNAIRLEPARHVDRGAGVQLLEQRTERTEQLVRRVADHAKRRVHLTGSPKLQNPAEECSALLDQAFDLVALDHLASLYPDALPPLLTARDLTLSYRVLQEGI